MREDQQESQSWLKFGAIITYFILYGFLVAKGDGDAQVNYDDPSFVSLMKGLQVFVALILFVLPAILFAALWTNEKIAYLGIKKIPKMGTLVLAAAGMLLAGPLIDWLTGLNQQIHFPEFLQGIERWMIQMEEAGAEATTALTGGSSYTDLFVNLFVVAFTAAVSEELFFRGVVQKVSLECFKNKHVAIWLSAILFSAGHLQFFGFLPRMFMGAYLGYLFYWSGSLWPGILAHFFNNGLIVLLTWLNNRGVISFDIMGSQATQGITVMVIFSILAVLSILFFIRRLENRTALA